MVSGLRFIIFVILLCLAWYPQYCGCGRLSIMDYIFIYYVMCSCLCEAWFYFYYKRRKGNVDRSREALSFYLLYFSIFVCISLPGWKEMYNMIYYYIFYRRTWIFLMKNIVFHYMAFAANFFYLFLWVPFSGFIYFWLLL